MKKENISILRCTFSKKRITAEYHNHLDDLNYRVENEELPHPDLNVAVEPLGLDLADALHIKGNERDKFKCLGFTIDEGDGVITIALRGTVTNKHGYITPAFSGKIPFESEKLIAKVDLVREELFAYFFEGKQSQQTIPGMPARGMANEPE